MKTWTGCSTPMPLLDVSAPAEYLSATELSHAAPTQISVPPVRPGLRWDSGMPVEVSIARFEESRDERMPSNQVELQEHAVSLANLAAKLNTELKPMGRTARTLWKDASTTIQLERSALSPAPQDPLEMKFRVWLQSTDEMPARGLDGAFWKNYPMDPMAEPPWLTPALTLSSSASDALAPECRELGLAGLPMQTPSSLHSLEEPEATELSPTLYPAFRRLPNPILTSD